jgi:hypothetical protein
MPNELADAAIMPAPKTPQQPAAKPAGAELPNIFDDLPPDVQQVPVIKMLAVGDPPAVMIEPGQYFPALEPIGKNLPKLLKGGLDFYKSMKGEGVLFNPLFLGEAELKKADESGKLEKMIPKYAELMGEDPQVVPDDKFDEILKQQEDNERGFRQLNQEDQGAEQAPAETQAPPPPAETEDKITQARTKNLAPQTPTTRAVPGGGQILNGILKRAV